MKKYPEKQMPIDYIIGNRPFLNCHIDLSYKPLIPRNETEYWVEKVIQEINSIKNKKQVKVLDIFSGSGCIGISVLKNCRKTKVDFAEYDKNLIKQIKKNLKINKIRPYSARVFHSDVFRAIKSKYDFILANPPYLALSRKNKVQKSVLDYEPHLALFGGQDGLRYVKKFLKSAKNYLNPDGKIYMEFDSFQKKQIEQIIKQSNYKNFEFFKDQFNRWRWVKIYK